MNLIPLTPCDSFESARTKLEKGMAFKVDMPNTAMHGQVLDVFDMLAMGVQRVKVFFDGGVRMAVIDITVMERE